MIRKVKFPLRYKFVTAISLLLLLTMTFYLSYALNIFKEDKAADVYSITLSNSISLGERLKLLINQDLTELSSVQEDITKLQTMVDSSAHILGAECLVNNETYLNGVNVRKLNELSVPPEKQILLQNEILISKLKSQALGDVRIETGDVAGFPPHYSLLTSLNENLRCSLHVSFEKLMPLMSETLNYGTYILAENATVFLKLNQSDLKNENLKKIVTDPTIASVQQGVKRFEEKSGTMIRAFSKVSPFGLIAITEIEENKAFLASAQLIQKSLYFGILLLSIAVITGILFTKRMTKNVQTLFEATTKISEGDFNVSPEASGHDEIGALTDSFVDMKDKIIAFMAEMKEKARIEGELKVAQLVQNSFFPKHGVIKKGYSLEGMYTPASECSGDWWGFFEQESRLTLIACDATGHGVPAALITAAAHSCLSTIKIDAETRVISPKDVLEKLNKVICSMNSEILMTAFVLEINEKENKLTYANASHMAPYHLRKINGEYNKEGLSALIENNGPRMGEKLSSEYIQSSLDFVPGDRVILFSDGLTEMEVDNKAWGQRNFLKSLYKHCAHSSRGILNGVMEDFRAFTNGAAPQDDITLIAVAFREEVPVIVDPSDTASLLEKKPEYVISQLSNQENIDLLLAASPLNHLIGFNTIDLESELKLVQILEGSSAFKLSDTIDERYKKKEWSLKSNGEINNVITEMTQIFELDYTPAINSDILRLVSEELLSNAFYHSNGHDITRGEQITLPDSKQVQYSFAVNNEYVVLSVLGPSSFSSREKIISSIQRGYTEKSPLDSDGGAGLGLYMIYQNCQQFWVINSPGKQGQIICVFEKFNRYKKAKERVTSFHFLSKEILQ